MKKLLSSVAVVLALSFGTSAPTLAEVVTNVSIPFNATIANACLGEPVALTGNLHLLIMMQETGNGTHMLTHAQPQGIEVLALSAINSIAGPE